MITETIVEENKNIAFVTPTILTPAQTKRLMVYAGCGFDQMIEGFLTQEYKTPLLEKLKDLRSQLENIALENPASIQDFSNKYDWLCNSIKIMTVDLAR